MSHKNKTNFSPYKVRQEKAGRSGPVTLKGTHKVPDKIYSLEEANDRLFDLFKNHEFGFISHEQRRSLAHFYVLLMQQQTKENFTRLLNIKDIGMKHFIDSIIVAKLTQLKFPLLDVGTGPGFPGIPLKIYFPNEKIILGEGVQKRVEFLKQVREEMKLPRLDIVGRNINTFFAYPVQGVITRAVEDIGNTLRNVMGCLQTGGRIYFMKGPGVDPEIALASKEDISQYYKLVEDHAYVLPKTDQNRRLLVYEKIARGPLIDFEDEPWPGEFENEGKDRHDGSEQIAEARPNCADEIADE
jgi:16S rRNA (guanine527-N7)-methyltransferase